jgi:hypothetical protein
MAQTASKMLWCGSDALELGNVSKRGDLCKDTTTGLGLTTRPPGCCGAGYHKRAYAWFIHCLRFESYAGSTCSPMNRAGVQY